jgi:hypothetical protein
MLHFLILLHWYIPGWSPFFLFGLFQAIAEHYNTKLSNGDTPVQDRVKSLESDAELGPIFEDIKKNGLEVDW